MDSRDYGENVRVIEKEDKDIEIDFSKIKNLFKRKKAGSEKAESSGEAEQETKQPVEEKSGEETPEEPGKPEEKTREKTEEEKTEPEESKESEAKETGKEPEKKPEEINREHAHERGETKAEREEKSEQRDDEINIDFGRIKRIFKREGKTSAEASEESEDSEIDIKGLVASIKSGLKGMGKASGDEDAVDVGRAFFFLRKHYGILLMIAAIIFSVWLGTSIRLEAGKLDFTDAWAANSINQALQQDIQGYVSQQFPNLPAENQQALINEELSKAQQAGTYTFRGGRYAGTTIDIRQQLEATSRQFKTFFQYDEDKGYNYMPDIDPYYWYRYANNILETGHAGDEVVDGVEFDNRQLAPTGRPIAPQDTFYPKAIVTYYKFVKFFDRDADLLRVMMGFPVFIMALTTILVFLIAWRISGTIAGFFAATMVTVHSALMTRTLFGHADTDSFVIFLSVLVLWLFVESLMAKNLKMRFGFGAAAGLATAIYSLSWGGWWWIFDFVLAASGGTLALFVLYEAFVKQKSIAKIVRSAVTRKPVFSIATYFVSSGIIITLFSGLQNFLIVPISSLGFRTIKTPVVANEFPNVLRTVAELNEGSVRSAFDQIGGSQIIPGVLMWMAILGISTLATITLVRITRDNVLRGIGIGAMSIAMTALSVFVYSWQGSLLFLMLIVFPFLAVILVYILTKYDRRTLTDQEVLSNVFYILVLSLWLAATTYSVTKGIRFVLLIVPAFSISFGILFGTVIKHTAQFVSKEFKFNKTLLLIILFIVFFLFFPGAQLNHQMLQTSRNAARNDVPIVNDAWFNALEAIRQNSQEDAIITSWWDFGHQFKALSGRRVTFDGTTQLSPQAHWVGRFFSTGDEKEALGILRMLNCGGVPGTQTLTEELGDSTTAVLLAKQMLLTDRENSIELMRKAGVPEEHLEEIADRFHCEPPESFVIASEDMIGKSGVWGHFGGWDFIKADVYRNHRDLSEDELVKYMADKYDTEEATARSIFREMQNLNDDRQVDAWISPWPGISNQVQGCGRQGEMVVCGDGLVVNLTSKDAWFQTQQGNLHPVSFVMPEANGTLFKRAYHNNTIPQRLSALLVPQGSNYFRIIADPQLIDSMFVRLFYLQGHGLKHFKLVTRQRGFTGNDIWVWQVDWKVEEPIILPDLRAPEPVEAEPSEQQVVKAGDKVTLQYIGYLENGSVFDSSIMGWQNREVTNETDLNDSYEYRNFSFKVGSGQVIPGFEEGVIGARLDEQRVINIAPEKGYTAPGHPLFNKTLYFRLRIDAIE